MVKHTQAIRRQKPTSCLNAFDHFVRLTLKGLRCTNILAFDLVYLLLRKEYFMSLRRGVKSGQMMGKYSHLTRGSQLKNFRLK